MSHLTRPGQPGEPGSQAGPELDPPGRPQVEVAVSTLALLADPTRLRILWLLARGDREVGALSALTGASPSATSQHLAKLRLAGLVSVRKQGRQHVYTARGSHVRNLVDEALYYADHRVSGEPDHD
jgi:DNA-binding transcriptional ArsR family regulator